MGYEYEIYRDLPYSFHSLNDGSAVTTRPVNLSHNPSIETNTSGWSSWGGPGSPGVTVSRETSGGFSGSAFVRATWSAPSSGVGGGLTFNTNQDTVSDGETITASVWVRPSKTQSMSLSLWWLNSAATTFVGTSAQGPDVIVQANTWTRLSVTGVVSSGVGANRVQMRAYAKGVTATSWSSGNTLDADAVLIEKSDQLRDYFEGTAEVQYASPLVRGSGASARLEQGYEASYQFPAFVQGRRSKSFTLEAWFLPLSGSSNVLGHSEGDGIVWNGSDIVFRLKLVSGDVEVSYTPEEVKTFHVVGVYSPSGIQLYVNGTQVGYNFTSEEQESPFVTFDDPTTLISSGSILIDSVAIYAYELPSRVIQRHLHLGLRSDDIFSAISQFGGSMTELNESTVNYGEYVIWQDDWRGQSVDVNTVSGVLRPDFVNNVSLPGVWQGRLYVDYDIAGGYIDFSAHGDVTVSVKVNEDAWSEVTPCTPIPSGQTDYIEVMVEFAGDVEFDDSYVSWLKIMTFNDTTIQMNNFSRTLNVSGSSFGRGLFYPIEQRELVGRVDGPPMSLEVVPEQPAMQVAAIELWVRPEVGTDILGGTGVGLTTAGVATGLDAYVNGTLGGEILPGEWNHVLAVLDTPSTDTILVADFDVTVGTIALYENVPSDPQALYEMYFSGNTLQVNSAGTIHLDTEEPEYDIYAYTWSIVGAGG